MARATLDLIDAIYEIAAATRPITGRGIAYKLFIRRLIASMAVADAKRVYRALLKAREQGFVAAIRQLIEPVAWQRCEVVNQAEQESLRTILDGWRAG